MTKKKLRQMQIPGTERTEIPEVEKAAEALREAIADKIEAAHKAAQKQRDLIAAMVAAKVKVYRYHDEHGEEIEARIEDEPKAKVKKTGEAESELGSGLEPSDSVPAGLVNEALRSQAEAGVEVDEGGDVVPPDKAAPKKKRGRKAKGVEIPF